jgi:hypothetical protein
MTAEELAIFDEKYVHQTAPSVNFVTNMVGCLIIAEAIKLLPNKGSVVTYAKYLQFDTFDFRIQIRNSNSIINLHNAKRFLNLLKNRITA